MIGWRYCWKSNCDWLLHVQKKTTPKCYVMHVNHVKILVNPMTETYEGSEVKCLQNIQRFQCFFIWLIHIKGRSIKFTFIMQLCAKPLTKHHFRVYLIYSGFPVHGTDRVYFLNSKCHKSVVNLLLNQKSVVNLLLNQVLSKINNKNKQWQCILSIVVTLLIKCYRLGDRPNIKRIQHLL